MKLNRIDSKVLEHWADNLINAIRYYRTNDEYYFISISISDMDCEYCKQFLKDVCCHCPVHEFTGETSCENTPYNLVAAECRGCVACFQLYKGIYKEQLNKAKKNLVEAIWKEYLFLKKVYGKI